MKRSLCLLLLWLCGLTSAYSSGLIILHDEDFWRRPPAPPFVPPLPHPTPRPPRPSWQPIELNSTQVRSQVKDQIATTTIEQEFYNPNSQQLEGTFLFPLPKGAQLDKFKMEINGKSVDAELMNAEKARGIFEDIVRKLRDPALLEYSGRDVYKVRIFPIEPHSKKRITVGYTQLLKSDGGLINFSLPLNTEKYSSKPLKSLSLKLDLETRGSLKSLYSPSHRVEIRREGDHKASVGFESSDIKSDADFQLFFSQQESDVGINLMTFKPSGEDGYFLLLASPGAETKKTKTIPKDVLFVLDTSGSMAGNKLEQAKKALLFCVDNLNDNDRFELMRFSTEVEPLFDKLVDAADKNRRRAREFIQDLKPMGGTAIDDALRKALAARPDKEDRPFILIFLTDGRPTIGLTDETQIVDNVTRSNRGNTRIFCFGIGTDVNTHLLDKITEETKAFSQYVLPEEDIEVKVSSFYTKIKEPVLASPKVTFPEGAHVTKLYPSALPDLFKGEHVVLVGRYANAADGAISIEGNVEGQTRKFAYDAKLPDKSSEHEFIPRLWATRRVGYLLDEIRLRGENKELKDEVTELARKYNIVTPYTAYLIIEDETRRNVPTVMRSLEQLDRLHDNKELHAQFYRFSNDKDGSAAVAGARSAYDLKVADAPTEAIRRGRSDSYGVPDSLGSAPAGSMSGRGPALAKSGGAYAYNAPASMPVDTAKKLSAFEEQSRFVQGRAFYRNGSKWIDGAAQNLKGATPVRIQFDSPEYFDLMKKHPEATAWLSLGTNLQLVLNNTLYEIYESE